MCISADRHGTAFRCQRLFADSYGTFTLCTVIFIIGIVVLALAFHRHIMNTVLCQLLQNRIINSLLLRCQCRRRQTACHKAPPHDSSNHRCFQEFPLSRGRNILPVAFRNFRSHHAGVSYLAPNKLVDLIHPFSLLRIIPSRFIQQA